MWSRFKHLAGWTLIELLIVLSILSVLLLFALPALQAPLDRAATLGRQQLLAEVLASMQVQLSWAQAQENFIDVEQLCSSYYQSHQNRFQEVGLSIECQLNQAGVLKVAGTGDFETIEVSSLGN